MSTPQASAPRLTLRGAKQPPTPLQVARRAILAPLAVANPTILLFHVAISLVVRVFYKRKNLGKKVSLLGAGLVVVGWVCGLPRLYFVPYMQACEIVASHDIFALADIGQEMRTHIGIWILHQIPYAACISVLTSGIYLWIRDYYTDTWREDEPRKKAPIPVRKISQAKKAQDQKIEHAAPARSIKEIAIPIGVDAGDASPYAIQADNFRTHAVVCGPTGVGKTQLLQRLLHGFCYQPQARHLRLPALVIDMKADPELGAYMQALAHKTGRKIHHITTRPNSDPYNPLARLEADEIADALYETLYAHDESANIHYATLSRRLLQTAARCLIDLENTGKTKPSANRPWRRDLHDLADLLTAPALRRIAIDLTPQTATFLARYLQDIEDTGSEKDLGDIKDRLATIIYTQAGQNLTACNWNIEDALEKGDLIIFSLDAATTPQTARTIGTLATQDAISTLARLAQKKWGKHHACPIILDEFSALQTTKVCDLYARARSAGGMVILATQDIDADLNAVSETFAATVRTNANIWFVLRQTRSDVAEAIAKDIGTRQSWKETLQIQDDWDALGGIHAASGVGSLREVEEFIIHPTAFKTLPQGACYTIIKIPTGTIGKHTTHTHTAHIHINAPQPLHLIPTYTQKPLQDETTQPQENTDDLPPL